MTTFAARVVARRNEAAGVFALDLEPVEAELLPDWEPGAHIDVMLDERTCRQYSLCGSDARKWSIAVQLADEGRGGSKKLFDEAVPGAVLHVSYPRNNFELVQSAQYLFIAGGIGITPIKAMTERVAADGADWALWYGGRSRDHMAFADSLANAYGERVTLVAENESGRIPVDDVLDRHLDSVVYCCGPESLIEVVAQSAQARGMEFRCERFSGIETQKTSDSPFAVRVLSTGQTLEVPRGQSIVDVLSASGIDVPTSCRDGVCGSCETPLVEGRADHRDSILSAEERAANTSMMLCVSRSRGDTLVLDI